MDFDQILDDCIQNIMDGSASLEDCLCEYPMETRLEPLLRVVIVLNPQVPTHPSRTCRDAARARMKQYLRAHPRDRQGTGEQMNYGDPSSSQESDRTLSPGLG